MSRIVILGAAESGVGAAILAKKEGLDVFVSDMGTIKPAYKEKLDEHGITWEEGQHTERLIINADEVIKSPGIPDTAPMVAAVRANGIPVISEIEFAQRYTDARMICITGSNGKTTTTSLIHHLCCAAGLDAGLAGNIGHSLALQVAESPHEYYVIELSSFQLDDMFDFRADVAVLLNITPDHLDRYGYDMQNYVNAKMRILRNQTPADTFIYWADDEYIGHELDKYNPASRVWTFADNHRTGLAAYVEGDEIILDLPSPFRMPVAELSLRGRHNQRNCMAAALAAKALGIPDEVIRKGLSDFPGIEHRLEFVDTVDGITYINDSKATNVDACYYALDSMTTPVILILGGKDKGNDYNEIRALVEQKCRALVYLGADNTKLHGFFDSLGLPVADTHSMADCVEACHRLARPGDTVLLSPCCASFDLFRNMEDRGEQFKNLVHQMASATRNHMKP